MRVDPLDEVAGQPSVADRIHLIGSDRAAFEAFYVEFYPELVRYFTRRVHDPYDVADLVAEPG